MAEKKIYPHRGNPYTVYLDAVVDKPNVEIGAYSLYYDFLGDPLAFGKNNILYQFPLNGDKLIMGKFCSVAAGAKFIFNSANHTMRSLANYPFPLLWDEWELRRENMADAWDIKGDIVVGNDVWIGFDALIFAGVTIGDGAVIAARAVVTEDVPPYTIVGGMPARPIRPRFSQEVTDTLLQAKWWDWPRERLLQNLPAIQRGDFAAVDWSPSAP